MAHILLAHSNSEVRGQVRRILERAGHWVIGVEPADISAHLASHRPDIAIVERTGDGESTVRDIAGLRGPRRRRPLPVILIDDDVIGPEIARLSIPAADAPPSGLLSLVRQAARMVTVPDRRFLRHGPLELDRDTRSVRLGENAANRVPIRHFALLWLLVQRAVEAEDLCPRSLVLAKIFRNRVRDREVDVTISRLKSRLPFLAHRIETIPRKGYRFILPAA